GQHQLLSPSPILEGDSCGTERQTRFPSPLAGEGGEHRAWRGASRVRGLHNPPLTRPILVALGSAALSHKGRGEARPLHCFRKGGTSEDCGPFAASRWRSFTPFPPLPPSPPSANSHRPDRRPRPAGTAPPASFTNEWISPPTAPTRLAPPPSC